MAKSAKGPIETKDTAGTGWSFTGVTDAKVGFHLQDISHDDHFFADSISVERIAVAGFSERDSHRPRNNGNIHVFGLGDCKEVAEPSLTNLRDVRDPLGYYVPRLKASAKYEMSGLVREADQKMEVEFAFLFTDYNKDPSHEPGGIIPAARIYPTLTFKVLDVSRNKKNPKYRRATAVQALFRINIRLDDKGIGNQCGIFTDLEDITPVGGAVSAVATRGKPGSFTFLNAEKPVAFEVVGRGVENGVMGGWDNTIYGWDNIHQYAHPSLPHGDPNEGYTDQPSTPGLPYGAHIHWRWSESAVKGGLQLPGGKQFGVHRVRANR